MSKKLTELEKQKAALAAEHKAGLAKLDARLKKEKQRLGKIERDADTRRKILVGATILQAAIKNADLAALLQRELQAFVVRRQDRILFGLPVDDEAKG